MVGGILFHKHIFQFYYLRIYGLYPKEYLYFWKTIFTGNFTPTPFIRLELSSERQFDQLSC